MGKAEAFLILGAMPFVGFALPAKWRLDVQRRGHSLTCGVLERIDDASFRAWTKWTLMAIGAVYLVAGLSTAPTSS